MSDVEERAPTAVDADVDRKHASEEVPSPVLEERLPESGFTTTRRELWAFYVYYIVRRVCALRARADPAATQGNNGLAGFNFGPSQFQNLLYLAGYDPTQPAFSAACGAGGCVLPYLGKVRSSASAAARAGGG
jgi:hypothetical protein